MFAKLSIGLSVLLFASTALAEASAVGRWTTIDDETGKPKSVVAIWEEGGKLFGKIEKAEPGWEDSAATAVTGLIVPVVSSPSFLLSVGVWAGVALLIGAIVGWTRQRSGGTVHEPLSIAPVGSSRVPNAH